MSQFFLFSASFFEEFLRRIVTRDNSYNDEMNGKLNSVGFGRSCISTCYEEIIFFRIYKIYSLIFCA